MTCILPEKPGVIKMDVISEIRRLHFVEGVTITDLAKQFKLSRPTIRKHLNTLEVLLPLPVPRYFQSPDRRLAGFRGRKQLLRQRVVTGYCSARRSATWASHPAFRQRQPHERRDHARYLATARRHALAQPTGGQ